MSSARTEPGRAGREVLSVGIDVGTTTTQVVFSRLVVRDVAQPGRVPRIEVTDRALVSAGEPRMTPLTAPDVVDTDALATLVADEYRRAGVDQAAVEMGAVIVTGETARATNAENILRALAAAAGDFVVTVAGPNAEAAIAGRGAGVARWSAEQYQQVTVVDIGGGTSNAAVFRNGRHLESSAAAVGGRAVELSTTGEVVRLSPPGQHLVETLGLELRVGEQATLETLRVLTDAMADLIADLVLGTPAGEPLQLTPPLTTAADSRSLFVTGGVGACYYAEDPVGSWAEITRYGDLGPLLADALQRNPRFSDTTAVLEPPETIRATVLGAATQTVSLSGSTIWTARGLLPLRNVPVVAPGVQAQGAGFGSALDAALVRRDLDREALVAVAVETPTQMDFSQLSALADEIAAQHTGAAKPLVLLLEKDYGQALGQAINRRAPGLPLLVVDQVGLGEGDYIDIGAPVLDGRAVPVSIKTLVFYD